MHLFLVGFMGAGKTHVGKALADVTTWPFLDMDAFIEYGEGKSISELFQVHGANGFREIERSYLKRIDEIPTTIIATGGGTPCFFNNMELINQTGHSIYLECSVEVLAKRLEGGKAHRPLIANLDARELRKFIGQKLEERMPFYRKAKITVKADGRIEEIVETIQQQLKTT